MGLKDQIRSAVNDMIQTKRISEPQNLSTPAVPTAIDISSLFDQYFNDKAKRALGNKAYSAVYQWNEPHGDIRLIAKDNMVEFLSKLGIKSTKFYVPTGQYIRKVATTHCFGFITSNQSKVSSAALKLVDVINHMAKFDFIRASLMDLSAFEISDWNDPSIKRYAVVSYLCIPSDLEQQVKKVYGAYMFEEGGIPPEYK